ncbi:hypothetical protein MPTK1_3g24110 [Marchantia polymorpha subsp. ruderalis]|uniref:Legume lectin domain-containing protein n=2 Tax=Marchantia polymorpha TaxID=3197 RepID=A0AAF6B482_MARPO|nr:hypothetical protein MARPO_0121s0013 [Marchantia polymorpha]BBN06816.1 hypothetical protein Mp_3g24110 [Marchantia polymorpha subsp. ruderalis]|eukprot:PTQ30659.1 hypothetical protein MARPO_0121s0013 [Marchantia polymorpha]
MLEFSISYVGINRKSTRGSQIFCGLIRQISMHDSNAGARRDKRCRRFMKTFLLLMLLTAKLTTLNSSTKDEDDDDDDVPALEEDPASSSLEAPVSFSFSGFSDVDRRDLKFEFSAELPSSASAIQLTPFDVGGDDVKGKVFYKNSIPMKDEAGEKTASFSTSFTFTIRAESLGGGGDGLAFVLAAEPESEGEAGGHFGIFTAAAAPSSTVVAVEFDTFMNAELMDRDANHVGVDVDGAVSLVSASASGLNISLSGGRPVTAWIDYYSEERTIEVRIGTDATKPSKPLIQSSLDMSVVLKRNMWVGFSAATSMAARQSHEISSWTFECESLGGGLSLSERIWKSVGSYVVCAVGATVVVLLIVCVVSSCCSQSCQKHCPRCVKCCSCCTRWCPCTSRCSTCCCPCVGGGCSRCKQWCGSRTCSKCCDEAAEASTGSPPGAGGKPQEKPTGIVLDEEKSCPQAFLDMIREDVSEEKDNLDLQMPRGPTACLPQANSFSLPFTNPFSTEQVLQPGCISSLLFGPDSDDELEPEPGAQGPVAAAAAPALRAQPLGSLLMVSNTVFDMPPEEEEHEFLDSLCPEHCPGRSRHPSAVDCLIGDNCLIESTVKHQKLQPQQDASPPVAEREVRPRHAEGAASAKFEDYTLEEQIAMGWGFFSP